jgi:hypothetical protein
MATTNRELEYVLRLRDEASKVWENYTKTGKISAQELEKMIQSASRAVDRHGRAVGGLNKWIREQRMEQRQQNFLFQQSREVVGAAAAALALFSNTAGNNSKEMRRLSDAMNDGFLTFQGIGNVLGFLPGSLSLVAAGVAGLAVAWNRLNGETNVDFTKLNDIKGKIDEIAIELGKLPRTAKFNLMSADLVLAENKLQRLQRTTVDYFGTVTSYLLGGKKPVVWQTVGTPEEIEQARLEADSLRLGMKKLTEETTNAANQTRLFVTGFKLTPVVTNEINAAIEALRKFKDETDRMLGNTPTGDRDAQKARAQAELLAEIRLAEFTDEKQKELFILDEWYTTSAEKAAGNEELLTRLREVHARRRAEIEQKYTKQTYMRILQYAQTAMGVLMQISGNRYQAELNGLDSSREATLRYYDTQLEKENLTNEQKIALMAARDKAERDYDQKRREILSRQAAAQKTAGAASVMISTAENITEAFPNPILMAAAAVIGAAQLAAVASAPTPSFHEGGSMFVNAPPEREVPMLVRGGETVEVKTERQQARASGSSIVINFNAPVSDEQFVIRSVQKAIDRSGLTIDKLLVARNSQTVSVTA